MTTRNAARVFLMDESDKSSLELFAKLAPGQWEKGGIHPVRGRFTIDAILSIMAWHDDNHLDQLVRALEGRV